jgi:FdhE protein
VRKIVERLAALEERPGISPDHLALESCLLEWRERVLPAIRKVFPDPELAVSRITAALAEDRPIAALVTQIPNVKVVRDSAAEFFTSIAGISALHDAFSPWRDRSPADSAVSAVDERVTDWFAAAWQGDGPGLNKLSAETGVDADILAWAGHQLVRPFFHRLGELLAPHLRAAETPKLTAGCPCCGGPPRFGRYARDEGRRHLWCELCDVQWLFRRITCAYCLNSNHEELGFLTVSGLEHYRIDFCRDCKGYLRSIDESKLPEGHSTDFLLEEVGTLNLCLAAEKEGWRPGAVLVDSQSDRGPRK